MKKILFINLLLYNAGLFAQGGNWAWMGGDTLPNQPPVFGTLGIPSPLNTPAGAYEPVQWEDLQGNAWLFGGLNVNGYSNDLWKYDMQLFQWIWMGGSAGGSTQPVFGIKGVASPQNWPGATYLYSTASWTDLSGNFWFIEYDKPALWKYEFTTGLWTWMNGDSTSNAPPVFGVQGIPSPNNTPGSRGEQNNCWTDNAGNLWLFGGWVYGSYYSDTWKYNISTNEWTWMSGPNISGQASVYGTKGVADPANNPGARGIHCKWKDSQGKLWMFGGYEVGSSYKNDTWKFDPAGNVYTWMNGTNLSFDQGSYGSYCQTDSTNLPASRWENSSCWNDGCDNFWLYGGAGPASLNDLWHFSPVTNQWTLVAGSNQSTDNMPVYGALGVPASANHPGVRFGAVSWIDSTNNLWMFGGSAYGGYANDIWKFTIDTICPAFSSCFLAPVVMLQSSDTIFCNKQSIDFTDLSANNPTSWIWYFPGAVPDTSTVQNPAGIYYANYGSFDVALKACNAAGCDSMFLPGFIHVLSPPVTPVISQNGDTLFSSPAFSYQWYESSNASVVLSTASFYVIQQPGNYYVITCDSFGCCVSSAIIDLTGILSQDLQSNCLITPNPNSGKFILSISYFHAGELKIELYNYLGEKITESTEKIFTSSFSKEINISGRGAGIYFVKITYGHFTKILKMTVLKE